MGYRDEVKLGYSSLTGTKFNICARGPFRESLGVVEDVYLMVFLLVRDVLFCSDF